MAKDTTIQIRTETKTKQKLELKAKENSFNNFSEYLIFVGLNVSLKVSIKR